MDQMIEAPETSVEVEEAKERFEKIRLRTQKNFGYGATSEALQIAQNCYERLGTTLEEELNKRVSGANGWSEKASQLLNLIPPTQIALVGINCALQGVVQAERYTTICEKAGEMLRHELFSAQLEEHDPKVKKQIEQWVREKHGNLKYRLQAARSLAKRKGFSAVARWTSKQYVALGHCVMDILLDTLPDLFTSYYQGDTRLIAVTAEAQKAAEQAVADHVRRFPVFLPSDVPPLPWTNFNDGGPVDPVARRIAVLVRTYHRETIASVKAAIKAGRMQPALDALNTVQAVPWKINTFVLNVIKECKQRGIDVDGLPSNSDIEMPQAPEGPEDLSDDDKKLLRRARAEVNQANRALLTDRLGYALDMKTAEVLAGMEEFYIPHNFDWRGREYPMTNFNFQREDRVRALFLFKDGEPIGEEGIAWLKVHVANCGDFGKVSKKSYDERIKWVDDNISLVQACTEPFREQALPFWTKADKPFLFLSACMELTEALKYGPEYICCLPCSWDGSCSGAQHLCAATRSTDAWKVNLCDRQEVHDLYTIVAGRAKGTMAEDQNKLLASTVLSYGGDWRKVFKRNTMTTFYGSKSFGMAHQHMTDLMEPLRLEVLKKKRKKHPFGETYKEQHEASRFLAGHASKAIVQELPLPMKAMAFLQDLAGLMAHVGKPLEWTTPVGIPWSNRYHERTTETVHLWMHDHGVKRQTRVLVATGFQKNIDKHRAKNGAAPNFVHACDAAHLLLTVNAARQEGITQFALVHDSFGSLPSHAARFQSIIREQFVQMYSDHDVLAEVFQQAKHDINEHNSRLSELEAKLVDLRGSFNINEVLDANYAFG